MALTHANDKHNLSEMDVGAQREDGGVVQSKYRGAPVEEGVGRGTLLNSGVRLGRRWGFWGPTKRGTCESDWKREHPATNERLGGLEAVWG